MTVAELLTQAFQAAISQMFGSVSGEAVAGFIETGKEILASLGEDTSGIQSLGDVISCCVAKGPKEADRIIRGRPTTGSYGGGRGGGCGCCGGCCGKGSSAAASNAANAAANAAGAASGGEGGGDTSAAGGAAGEAAEAALAEAGEAGNDLGEAAADEAQEEMADDMAQCTNPGCSGKPSIELGEMAKHAVVLGDMMLNLFNRHRHKGVQPGGGLSGPPKEKMTCAEHLSHVVFAIRDPSEQPSSAKNERIEAVGKKFLEAPQSGSAAPESDSAPSGSASSREKKPKQSLLDKIAEFCDHPGQVIGDAAKGGGLPPEVVDCAQGAVDGLVKTAINAGVTAVENAVGIDLPDMDSMCQVAKKLQEGKWFGAALDVVKQAVKTTLPAVVAGVTAGLVPPHITTAVLNAVEGALDSGASQEGAASAAAAAAEAVGGSPCEGLTALGGIVNSGVVKALADAL